VPLDHGCGLDQNHRFQAARPSSVEPGPQQAIASPEPRSTGPPSAENSQLMSEGQHLKFQGDSTPKPEGDHRNHRGQDRKHAGHGKAIRSKLQCLLGRRNFEQLQRRLAGPCFDANACLCRACTTKVLLSMLDSRSRISCAVLKRRRRRSARKSQAPQLPVAFTGSTGERASLSISPGDREPGLDDSTPQILSGA